MTHGSDNRDMNDLPGVSVVMPVYNAASRITECLDSITSQDYPQHLVELVIIDDDSTDDTKQIVERYGATVLRNGTHDCEQGKYIGLKHARHPLILFLDDDNILPTTTWLSVAVNALLDNPEAVGAQTMWITYRRTDAPVNRYFALFGVGDPTVLYLGKAGQLMYTEKTWRLPETIAKETDNYYLLRFTEETQPTLGSQGYLARRDLMLTASTPPYFFHLDAHMELLRQGHPYVVFVKQSVVHVHSSSLDHLIGKLRRNIVQRLSNPSIRSYDYALSTKSMLKTGLIMITVVIPLRDSIRGYQRIADPAWFIHPYLCYRVALLYGSHVIRGRIAKTLESMWQGLGNKRVVHD